MHLLRYFGTGQYLGGASNQIRFVCIAENTVHDMIKLASWESSTDTRPTIESHRTISTVSFPLKSTIRRKAESSNVPANGAKSGAKGGAKTTPRQGAIIKE